MSQKVFVSFGSKRFLYLWRSLTSKRFSYNIFGSKRWFSYLWIQKVFVSFHPKGFRIFGSKRFSYNLTDRRHGLICFHLEAHDCTHPSGSRPTTDAPSTRNTHRSPCIAININIFYPPPPPPQNTTPTTLRPTEDANNISHHEIHHRRHPTSRGNCHGVRLHRHPPPNQPLHLHRRICTLHPRHARTCLRPPWQNRQP